jgi:cysteine-rich repeat protein
MPVPRVAPGAYDAQLTLSSPTQSATYFVRYAQGNLPFASGTIAAGGSVLVTAGPDHVADYGDVGAQALFVVSTASDLEVQQITVGDDWEMGATVPPHWAALGVRFRVAGFGLDLQGPGSGPPPDGVDSLSLYAPTGAVVTVDAPGITFSTGDSDVTVLTLLPRQSVVVHGGVGGNLDGALVTATKPITVMTGGRGFATDGLGGFCDGNDAGDVAIPTFLWGKQFVVGAYGASQDKDVRVVADNDGTSVTLDGGAAVVLEAGQVLTFAEPVSVGYVEADKPVAVYQTSGPLGCEVELAYVPPLVFANVTASAVTANVIGAGTVAVVGPAAARPTLTVDGIPLASPDTPVPGRADLFFTMFSVTDVTVTLAMDADFQVAQVSTGNGGGARYTYLNAIRAAGCGDTNVDPGEGCDDGNLVPNDHCSPVCTNEPIPGGCVADTDCPPGRFCNGTTLFCEPLLGNGTAVPNDGLHDGTCSVGNASAVCESGQCNVRAATCAGFLLAACDDPNDCVIDICGGNHQCGLANGEGACDLPSAPVRCQAGACSTEDVCIPSGGCFVDSECDIDHFCERSTFACHTLLSNGTPISDDGLHDGTCTEANALAVCLSDRCNSVEDTCGALNGEVCNDHAQCVVDICGDNGLCGVADGDGPCADTTVCQSAACSVVHVCIPPGTCLADGDCSGAAHCDRAGSHLCVPDLSDGTHGCSLFDPHVCESDRCSTAGVCIPPEGCYVPSDCVSDERCDAATLTCMPKSADGTPCADADACLANACTDGACGLPHFHPLPPPGDDVPANPDDSDLGPDPTLLTGGGCAASGQATAVVPLLTLVWLATRRRFRAR